MYMSHLNETSIMKHVHQRNRLLKAPLPLRNQCPNHKHSLIFSYAIQPTYDFEEIQPGKSNV